MRRGILTAVSIAAGVGALIVAGLAISGGGESSEQPVDLTGLPRPPDCDRGAATPASRGQAADDDPSAPLIPRRADGRLPIGFNDGAYLAGQATVGQSAGLQRRVGSQIWRSVAQWQVMEPRPDAYDFATTDPVYCAAVAAGVAPLFHITTTPPWAADPGYPCASRCVSPPLAEHYPRLERFAAALASRYPKAAAIEAWNEPNLHLFWAAPDPDRYAEVLREVYLGVKAVDPTMPVLYGGLSNVTSDDPATGDVALDRFLAESLAAGAGSYFDALNIHVYPRPLDADPARTLDETMSALRTAVAAAGLEPQPRIWVTELGVAAVDGIDRDQQAAELQRYYASLSAAADVDAVLFHTLIEPNALIGGGAGFGWVGKRTEAGGFPPFPVYCRFAAMLTEPLDCTAPVALQPGS